MENEKIELENLKITVSSLKHEAATEGNKLSKIIKEREKTEKELSVLMEKIEFETQDRDKKVKEERERSSSERISLELEKESKKKEIFSLGEILRESEKKLSRSNSWILSAEKEKEEKSLEIEVLDKTIKEKEKLIHGILELQDEIKKLEIQRDSLRLDVSLLSEEGNKHSEHLKKELENIIHKSEELKKEADESEYRKKKFDDEYSMKQNDLDIYHERILEAWKIIFPNRNMPMIQKI